MNNKLFAELFKGQQLFIDGLGGRALGEVVAHLADPDSVEVECDTGRIRRSWQGLLVFEGNEELLIKGFTKKYAGSVVHNRYTASARCCGYALPSALSMMRDPQILAQLTPESKGFSPNFTLKEMGKEGWICSFTGTAPDTFTIMNLRDVTGVEALVPCSNGKCRHHTFATS